jgi:hypothetical protein
MGIAIALNDTESTRIRPEFFLAVWLLPARHGGFGWGRRGKYLTRTRSPCHFEA